MYNKNVVSHITLSGESGTAHFSYDTGRKRNFIPTNVQITLFFRENYFIITEKDRFTAAVRKQNNE